MNKRHFDKIIPTIITALENCDFQKNDITDLILLGGSSRIPKIKEILKEELLHLEPCPIVNPYQTF